MTEPTVHDPQRARFAPRAAREMAGMFDDVSGRYDWLNRLMTFGQDEAWRVAMWRAIPGDAVVVLDLCTGSGVSTTGLRRPGRTVLGIDVSLRMLQAADAEHGGPGWAPRFSCADGFALPLRDHGVDAITIAFGVRNLRPRAQALAEMLRVLRRGGTLAVLEATAPAPGPVSPLASAWIRHGIPLLGRLSPDPSAYAYLSRSIFEFGSGPEFERDLAEAGFTVSGRRSFMFGATRLWTARADERIAADGPPPLQDATRPARSAGIGANAAGAGPGEWRAWAWINAAVAGTLLAALVWGAFAFAKWAPALPLHPWQRSGGWLLLTAGIAIFGFRTLLLSRRAIGPGPRP